VGRGQTTVILRTILSEFLFSGDDVNKKIRVLSGGERSRLAFAKMLLHPANFIILDEPTNHIDAQTKEILQGALSDYEGTLLIVSHDRHFLDNLVNKVIEIKEGHIKAYIGNFTDYHDKKALEARLASEKKPIQPKARKSDRPIATKDQEKKLKSTKKKNEKKLAEIESAIQNQEELKNRLEAKLADPEIYKKADEAKKVQQDYQNTSLSIAQLYEEWEKLTSN